LINNTIAEMFPAARETLDLTKLILLHGTCTLGMNSTKAYPLNSAHDLEGMRMVGAGKLTTPKFEALGVSCVDVEKADKYMALEKGVGNCSGGGYELNVTHRFSDICVNAAANFSTGRSAFWISMNWDTWNSLPAGVQEAFDGMDREAIWQQYDEYWWSAEVECERLFREEFSGTSYYWSDEDHDWVNELWTPINQEYIDGMDAKGYPMSEMTAELWRLNAIYSGDWPYLTWDPDKPRPYHVP